VPPARPPRNTRAGGNRVKINSVRHRAVLFGLLAAFLAYAAFHRHLHSLALIAAAVSVVAFLALAISVRNYNSALSSVVKADILALALLV
jgi:hypothetical protein